MNGDLLELLYWEFDARRKGYGEWRRVPQSERDAFKHVMVQFAAITARDELLAAVGPKPKPTFRFRGFWSRVWER
jgi:hypothetical protein